MTWLLEKKLLRESVQIRTVLRRKQVQQLPIEQHSLFLVCLLRGAPRSRVFGLQVPRDTGSETVTFFVEVPAFINAYCPVFWVLAPTTRLAVSSFICTELHLVAYLRKQRFFFHTASNSLERFFLFSRQGVRDYLQCAVKTRLYFMSHVVVVNPATERSLFCSADDITTLVAFWDKAEVWQFFFYRFLSCVKDCFYSLFWCFRFGFFFFSFVLLKISAHERAVLGV